jgi:hypothetical protein
MTDCRDWPAGTRVRCVDARNYQIIKVGAEYVVDYVSDSFVNITAHVGGYWPARFKPVVRVPMGRRQVTTQFIRGVLDQCCDKTVLVRCEGCPHSC